MPGCAILSMTGGDAGGLHRTLQTIPPHLLSTPWILAGAIRGIPGIGGLPARETGIRGAKPCSLAIRDAVAVPCSNGIVPYDTPPSTYVCTVLPDPVSLIFSGVHPCVAAGTLQPPGQVIHDLSGREHGRSRESRVYRCPAGTCATTFRNMSTVNPTGYDPHDTREMPRDTYRSPFVSFQAREGGGHRVVSLRKGASRQRRHGDERVAQSQPGQPPEPHLCCRVPDGEMRDIPAAGTRYQRKPDIPGYLSLKTIQSRRRVLGRGKKTPGFVSGRHDPEREDTGGVPRSPGPSHHKTR